MIQTHIITGFLGVGKTTTLAHLIKQKPKNEKWVVLLNEFGKTGLDALLLACPDVVIKQVAGGCLCCVTQVHFQTALNQLIRFEKPQRIFIEPSGLGHPDETIKILKQDQYKQILEVQPAITLIDPRHLSQERYRQHEIYTRQLATADIFVANKTDLANDQDLQAFQNLLIKYNRPGVSISNGQLSLDNLLVSGQEKPFVIHKQPSTHNSFYTETLMLNNRAQWSADEVVSYLTSLQLLRIKGLVPTEHGSSLINIALSEASIKNVETLDEEYRLELIDSAPIDLQAINHALDSLGIICR